MDRAYEQTMAFRVMRNKGHSKMKYLLITAAFSAAIAASGVAKADTINFSQFTGTLGSSITGTTEAGDAVTIAGPENFQLLVQGTSWGGEF